MSNLMLPKPFIVMVALIVLAVVVGCTATDSSDPKEADSSDSGDSGDTGPAPAAGVAGVSAAFVAGSESELPRCSNCAVTLAVSGMSSMGSTLNTSNHQLSPNATMVARDLSVAVEVAPGSGTRLFILSVLPFQSGQDLRCSITGPATTCNSGDQTLTIPPGSGLIMTVGNTADAPATRVRFGWRATTL